MLTSSIQKPKAERLLFSILHSPSSILHPPFSIDLSIVIVNWNVRELLRRCLSSVYRATGASLKVEVIVVDNASSDGSAAMVSEDFSQVRLIANEKNLGFTRGNNQAIAQSRGRYVLLLNPDTEVVDDALGTMVQYMDAHPQVGALGPQLLNPDGSVQSSRRRFPTMATAFLESTVLQQWFPDNRILRRYYIRDRGDDEVQEVDWVVAALKMLVRRVGDPDCASDEITAGDSNLLFSGNGEHCALSIIY